MTGPSKIPKTGPSNPGRPTKTRSKASCSWAGPDLTDPVLWIWRPRQIPKWKPSRVLAGLRRPNPHDETGVLDLHETSASQHFVFWCLGLQVVHAFCFKAWGLPRPPPPPTPPQKTTKTNAAPRVQVGPTSNISDRRIGCFVQRSSSQAFCEELRPSHQLHIMAAMKKAMKAAKKVPHRECSTNPRVRSPSFCSTFFFVASTRRCFLGCAVGGPQGHRECEAYGWLGGAS